MKRLALLVGLVGALLVPVEAQAATGVIEGRVTPLEWAPEVEVCVVEGRPSETCTTPAADGTYTLYEVPFGGARIEFVPSVRSGLLKQYWEEASQLEVAKTIFLTKEAPRIGGIDAELFAAGSIKGTVTAASGGEALPQVEVCAVSLGTPPSKGCAETGPAGGYEIHGLAPERYSVRFLGIGRSGRYEPAVRAPVTVPVGATATVDASLLVGSRIEGTISAAGGTRLGGVPVCLFVPSAGGPDRCTYSEPAGNYFFEGLPAGSYQVGFSLDAAELGSQGSFGEDGFEPQYFDGVRSLAEATVISLLTPGSVASGVDAVLSAPPAPPPPPPAPLAASPVVVTPTVGVPEPKKSETCKKPKRKKKVNGKARCVKPSKKKAHKKKAHKEKGARQKGAGKHGGKK